MRSFYEPLNRKKRAENKRRDADELHRAGYPTLAEVAWQEAEFLDPYVEEEYPE